MPERLRRLLKQHAEHSQGAAGDWTAKAKEADKELRATDDAIKRLYEMVECGIAPLDDTLGKRLVELRQPRAVDKAQGPGRAAAADVDAID